MSYVRLGPDSDLYIYEAAEGFVCQWCALRTEGDTVTVTAAEMIAHVREHVDAGHKVKDYVIQALETGDG